MAHPCDPDAAGRQWALVAQDFLEQVAEAVDELRRTFRSDPEAPPDTHELVASRVISACIVLIRWLRSTHPPSAMAKAGDELGAAAGVYRNAAVAFKSLADVRGDQRQARSKACATLLQQGDDHAEIFVLALASKLGGEPS